MTARSHGADLNVQSTRDRGIEHDNRRLHENGPAETGRDRCRPVTESLECRRQAVDAIADPLGMQDRQRLQQPPHASRSKDGRRRRHRASTNPAHSHDGQIGEGTWPARPAAIVAPSAATSTRPMRPMTRSARMTVVASVFEPRRPRGVANPDHVAADVARQEVVEEERRPGTNRARLRPERRCPAPRAAAASARRWPRTLTTYTPRAAISHAPDARRARFPQTFAHRSAKRGSRGA